MTFEKGIRAIGLLLLASTGEPLLDLEVHFAEI